MLAEYPMTPDNEILTLDDSTPDGVARTDVTHNGTNLFIYKKPIGYGDEDRIIYYIHGGGFVRGNKNYCRRLAILHEQRLNIPAAACEYRTAPAHKFPEAQEDCYQGYRYLVDILGCAPDRIIFAGDSAGGNLLMSLALRLKRQGETLPNALIMYSPAIELTGVLESQKYNIGKDVIFTNGVPIATYYAAEEQLKTPEVSPYYGDFGGFPPSYFCAEETEVFLSDTVETAAKMRSLGVKVKAHIWRGLWHVFPVYSPETAESAAVFADVKNFLAEVK